MEKNKNLKKYIGIAVFSALALVVALVCNIIPPIAGFLSLDAKDAVIAMASFVYGPLSAVIIAFISALIEMITFSTTGWYGFIMNFASSAVFSLTASIIYKKIRNINGALIAFFAAVVATTGIMLVLNIFVTPLYLAYIGVPKEAAATQVMEMLPTILLPFNFAKSLMNAAIAMVLYKPITLALRKARLIRGDSDSYRFNRSSVIILIVGTIGLMGAITIFLILS